MDSGNVRIYIMELIFSFYIKSRVNVKVFDKNSYSEGSNKL